MFFDWKLKVYLAGKGIFEALIFRPWTFSWGIYLAKVFMCEALLSNPNVLIVTCKIYIFFRVFTTILQFLCSFPKVENLKRSCYSIIWKLLTVNAFLVDFNNVMQYNFCNMPCPIFPALRNLCIVEKYATITKNLQYSVFRWEINLWA